MTASPNFTEKYQRKAKFWAKILNIFPGVSAIFLSGSLAQGRASAKSDIDIFIVAKPGRIFTARFFINAFLKLTRQLASEKNHDGKLCPNHFITDTNLEIQEKDAYSANLFSHNKFLAGDEQIWKKFILANQEWVKNFNEKFPQEISVGGQEIEPSRRIIKKSPLEALALGGDLEGDAFSHEVPPDKGARGFEKFLKNYQISRIKKNQKNLPDHACIILTDQEIRLHPNPKNRLYRS